MVGFFLLYPASSTVGRQPDESWHQTAPLRVQVPRCLICPPSLPLTLPDPAYSPRAPSPGTKSAACACNAIELTARIDKFTSPRQIVRQLFLDASPRTVDRRLQEVGLFGRVARHKRDYTPAEVRQRLAFAEGYGGYSKEWWERVIFSDEKTFYGKGFCGRIWVRRPVGEALNPEYTVHKQASVCKVNVWACFCAKGPGYAHIYNVNLDKHELKRILSANLIPSAQMYFSFDPPEQWYFLHDNAPTFSSGVVQGWLHGAGVTHLEFPPYSPDLNPMENLWNDLARTVEKHSCQKMEELQEVVAAEWAKLSKDLLLTLAHSMPARCKAVIEAQGWHTKY